MSDRINNGVGLYHELGVETGNGQDLVEGLGFGIGDDLVLEEEPMDCMELHNRPINSIFVSKRAELVKGLSVWTGNRINNGAGLNKGLGIGTDNGPELAEGLGVGTSDDTKWDVGQSN